MAILLADFFNLPVAVLHADYHKWSISPSGISAGDPLWSPDGSELFYRDLDAEKLVAVDVETGDKFAAGTPRVLFDDCPIRRVVVRVPDKTAVTWGKNFYNDFIHFMYLAIFQSPFTRYQQGAYTNL